MRIAFLMMRHASASQSALIQELLRLLPAMGAVVDVIYPEERLIDLVQVRPEHDLYVLKSRTEMALALAGALHASGAAVLNPYPVSALLRDKITTGRMLMAAGVPTPESFVTAHPELLAPLLAESPLAVKPYRGSGARGVHVVWDADELDDVPSNQGPILAQRFKERSGGARRVYCIGGQLFGVRSIWPVRTREGRLGEVFTLTPRLRDVASRCAKVFGIELFGLDIIGDDDNPYVVDVHSFPDFKGVPEAALRLADYIYHVGQRTLAGQPPGPRVAPEGEK